MMTKDENRAMYQLFMIAEIDADLKELTKNTPMLTNHK